MLYGSKYYLESAFYENKKDVAESWKKSSDTFKAIIESWDEEENPLAAKNEKLEKKGD